MSGKKWLTFIVVAVLILVSALSVQWMNAAAGTVPINQAGTKYSSDSGVKDVGIGNQGFSVPDQFADTNAYFTSFGRNQVPEPEGCTWQSQIIYVNFENPLPLFYVYFNVSPDILDGTAVVSYSPDGSSWTQLPTYQLPGENRVTAIASNVKGGYFALSACTKAKEDYKTPEVFDLSGFPQPQ